jgi:tryptophan synthase alpha chain
MSSQSSLEEVFERAKQENRAVLIGYMPAGFPTKEGAIALINAMIEGGVDIVEVGFPYSDPIMDGVVIQNAVEIALENKISAQDVLDTVSQSQAPTLVMSYWNPIEKYGIEKFAQSLIDANGVGVITPDLTIEEAEHWHQITSERNLHRVYVLAPSSSDLRIGRVSKQCTGFIYAASLMGVTGTRTSLSDEAQILVERIRKFSELPVAVGLGVSTPEQAAGVAKFADGVIVGSAFIRAVFDSTDPLDAQNRLRNLARELAAAVRQRD